MAKPFTPYIDEFMQSMGPIDQQRYERLYMRDYNRFGVPDIHDAMMQAVAGVETEDAQFEVISSTLHT